MNQLNGKYVNVVLSVESGRGMEFMRNGAHIVGIFNNRVLESDKVPPHETPLFNTELVWEIDKRQLRKIRSANQPLRVECVCADSANRRERVGFALLSLRSAQIVPEADADRELTFAWHRLIGCQGDKRRKRCPELYLSLALRDHLPNAYCASAAASAPLISQQVGEQGDCADRSAVYRAAGVSVRYLDDGHVEIGCACAPDGGCACERSKLPRRPWLLNLLVRDVGDLHALLPESVVFGGAAAPDCHLSFDVLGVTVRTRPIAARALQGRCVQLDEKICVNVVADEDTLRSFVSQHRVPVTFGCADRTLGVAEVATSFEPAERECAFRKAAQTDTCGSPRISVAVWVEARTAAPRASNFSKASLDEDEDQEGEVEEEEEEEEEAAQVASPAQSAQPTRRDVEHTAHPTRVDASPSPPPPSRFQSAQLDPADPYRKYVVELELTSVLWRRAPPTDKITFRFLHPTAATRVSVLAETPVDVGVETPLGGTASLGFRIGYVTTEARLSVATSQWRPWLALADESDAALTEPARLCADGGAVELRDRSGAQLVRIRYRTKVRNVGLDEPEDYERLYLLPAVLDELIAVKHLAELQTWKDLRRTEFDAHLESIKTDLLERLEREHRDKRLELERRFSAGVERCRDLQQLLRSKLDSLRVERELDRCCASGDYADIFSTNWRRFGERNERELVELLSKAQRDNRRLRRLLDEKARRLGAIERCSLSKTQTAHLLDELRSLEGRFEEARESKRYFKEQWRRACEEVHGLRVGEIDGVRAQIRESREELRRGGGGAECGDVGDVD